MKKILLLSTLLSAAMSMSAQELVKADLAERVPVKVSNTLATPMLKPAMQYTNSAVNMSKAPAADWAVYTLADGVYSQIPVWMAENGFVGSYPVDVLYGPVLVGWQWKAYRPVDATVGEPTFSFVQRDLSGDGEDVDLPVVNGYGVSSVFGVSESVVRVTGVNGDGATASWDRMDVIAPSDPSATATSLMWSPVNSERVNFSQAYWGNIYGYYIGYSSGEYYGDGYRNLTGVASVFRAPITPLYVFGGNAIVKSIDGATSVDASNISFEIWTLTEDGQLSEPIAQATGGQLFGDPVAKDNVGSLEFSFTENDPITGLPIAKPVSIPAGKPFAVVLNNMQGSKLRVLMSSDPCGGIGQGGARLVIDEALSYLVEGYDFASDDVAIGLNGYIPGGKFLGSTEGTDFLMISDAGGVASTYSSNGDMVVEGGALFGCSHNFFVEDGIEGEAHVKMTYPDWITKAAVDTTDYYKTGRFALMFEADALPDGVNGRDGYVELDVYGFKSKIQIGQGEFTVGVNDAQVAEASARVEGENIVLTYGEGVNAVDVINVAGARVASYALPAGGNFTVPASDYAKGLYILNFKGDKKATVKVVK